MGAFICCEPVDVVNQGGGASWAGVGEIHKRAVGQKGVASWDFLWVSIALGSLLMSKAKVSWECLYMYEEEAFTYSLNRKKKIESKLISPNSKH